MVASATKRFDANAVGYIDEWSDEAGGAVAAADVLADTSYTTYIDSNSASDVREAFTIDTTFVERFAHVLAVRVHVRHKSDGSGSGTSLSQKPLVRINSSNVEGSAFNSTGTSAVTSEALARPGGGDWTEDDFRLTGSNAFNFGVFHPSQTPEDCFVDELWVEVDYIPLARSIEAEREIASRKLFLERGPAPLITVVGGWDHAAAELMDMVSVSHAQGPNHDQTGWGVANWQRAFGRYQSQRIDLLEQRIESTVADRRRYMTTLHEFGAARLASDPDVADGLARLDASGAGREFSRTSKAWIEDITSGTPPGAVGQVLQLNEAKEKFEPRGQLIEEARTNLMTQSSFVNGTTGWTKTENAGSATFAQDTTRRLFETSVTPGGVRIVITASSSNIDTSRATNSLSGSTAHTISVDWQGDAVNGTPLTQIAIQNDTTGNYYNGSTWGASVVYIGLVLGETDINRVNLTFTTESTASTHTIYFNAQGNTGTAYNLQHVQLEAGPYRTSRIVTEASAVTRAADSLAIDNASSLDQRIWPVDKFTTKIVFTPWWSQSSLDEAKVFCELYHDANNSIRVGVAFGDLRFQYIHGGTTENTAFLSSSLAADTEYTIVIRRCSNQLEYGNADGQLTVFLDGVKGGTEDSTGTDLTESADSKLYIGQLNDGTLIADGWIKEIKVSPVVYSDEEIAAGI